VPENHFDKVIETALTPDTLRRMARAARPGGTLVLKSRQSASVHLNPRTAIRKQLTIRAVNYGSLTEALALLGEGRLSLEGLLGDVYPLTAFEKVFDLAQADESTKLFFDPTGTHVRYRG
jgi:threonine dehydrogenase-like Zn-dependent dehydrogenase